MDSLSLFNSMVNSKSVRPEKHDGSFWFFWLRLPGSCGFIFKSVSFGRQSIVSCSDGLSLRAAHRNIVLMCLGAILIYSGHLFTSIGDMYATNG